jgi:hypothetical protein
MEMAGRPSSPQTRNFLRRLSDPQRMILLAAGNGDLSKGFENVLDLYQYAHNEGYRSGMELNSLQIGRATTNNPNSDQSIVGKVREDIREDKVNG